MFTSSIMSQLINPKYDSIQVHLRSDDPDLATDKSESAVSFTFQRIINIPVDTRAVISVLNAQIPNTFYNLTKRIRLTMYIDINASNLPYQPSTNVTHIFLEIGQYDNCSLAEVIDEQTSSADPADVPVAPDEYPNWKPGTCHGPNSAKKWEVCLGTGKIGSWCIAYPVQWENPPFSGNWQLLEQADPNTTNLVRFFGLVDGPIGNPTHNLDAYLGNYQQEITCFAATPPIPVTAGGPNTPWGEEDSCYYSPEIPDFTGHHNLYIGTKLITNSVDSLVGGLENVLAKIPVSAPFGSMIQYNGESRTGTLLNQQFISEIYLEIQDHNNQTVELNGVRWNITLLIQFIEAYAEEDSDKRYMQNELIRTAPLASQERLRAGNRNRKIAIKHKIKKYLDDVLPSRARRKAEIKAHSIGKTPMLQGLTGVVGGNNPPVPVKPVVAAGVDIPMAQPLPN